MMSLDDLWNLFGRQVQLPVDQVHQPELTDAQPQLLQIAAGRAERHLRLAAAREGQAYGRAQGRFLGKDACQCIKQVFDALAAIDEAEVQQAQRFHRR